MLDKAATQLCQVGTKMGGWCSSHVQNLTLSEMRDSKHISKFFFLYFPLRASLLIFSNNIPTLTALFQFY
jgi:hypothetical protein